MDARDSGRARLLPQSIRSGDTEVDDSVRLATTGIPSDERSPLSPAQQRIARRVAAGRTNREIAAELGVTSKTVEWHLSRIYRQLGLRSRTELAVQLAAGEIPGALEPER